MQSKLKGLLIIAVIISIIAGTFYSGILFGYSDGYDTAMNESSNKSQQPSPSNMPSDIQTQAVANEMSENQKLRDQYNALVNDYNNLLTQTANNNSYAPRTPVTCNSYTYGMNSATTTCY